MRKEQELRDKIVCRVKIFRVVNGLSYQDLGNLLGKSRQYAESIEKRKRFNPTLRTLVLISRALQITVKELIA
jgi:transcriptional regulator with XRE-family HTH domain